MMGQSVNRSVKRYRQRMFNGRAFRGWYECAACLTEVKREDNYCRSCGLDIREIKEDQR